MKNNGARDEQMSVQRIPTLVRRVRAGSRAMRAPAQLVGVLAVTLLAASIFIAPVNALWSTNLVLQGSVSLSGLLEGTTTPEATASATPTPSTTAAPSTTAEASTTAEPSTTPGVPTTTPTACAGASFVDLRVRRRCCARRREPIRCGAVRHEQRRLDRVRRDDRIRADGRMGVRQARRLRPSRWPVLARRWSARRNALRTRRSGAGRDRADLPLDPDDRGVAERTNRGSRRIHSRIRGSIVPGWRHGDCDDHDHARRDLRDRDAGAERDGRARHDADRRCDADRNTQRDRDRRHRDAGDDGHAESRRDAGGDGYSRIDGHRASANHGRPVRDAAA